MPYDNNIAVFPQLCFKCKRSSSNINIKRFLLFRHNDSIIHDHKFIQIDYMIIQFLSYSSTL